MKNFSVLLFLTLLSYSSNAQSFIQQLNNSVERSDGGAGANVEYHVFLTPSSMKVFYAHDWEQGGVKGHDGDEQYFELTRKKNGEEESFMINLDKVAYMELEVNLVKGKKEFVYKFYF